MASLNFTKRVTGNISKSSPKHLVYYFQSGSRISKARCLSSAYDRAEGSNAAAESTNPRAGAEVLRDAQEPLHVDEARGRGTGMTGYVSDKVKGGARKAAETAEDVGDTAKQAGDAAWRVFKDTSDNIKDKVIGDDADEQNIDKDPAVFEAEKTNDPVDTQEYRSIEELRRNADGSDKASD